MNLKKINPHLQKALLEYGLENATELQTATFPALKSGADVVIAAPAGSGKSSLLIIATIQNLEKSIGQSPRTLVFSESRESVQELERLFKEYARYTDLRIFAVHDKGDIDYDKNQISAGIDILIGTPNRLNEMFSSAGFDVNRLKMLIADDADILFKSRHDNKIARISESIAKVQRIFFCETITEKVEIMADKTMRDAIFYEAGGANTL